MNQYKKTKIYKFYVAGMHCDACTLLIETKLSNQPGVIDVKANLKDRSLEVSGDFGAKSDLEVAAFLTLPIKENGYNLLPSKDKKNWSDFKLALPIAIVLLILFFAIQNFGFLTILGNREMSIVTSFLFGIIASLSTSIMVVGGLLLSVSANFAKKGGRFKPQLLFHLGRIVSFFVLGGVIGSIGDSFLGIFSDFILNLVIGIVMLILGLNLLDVFDFGSRLKLSLPKTFFSYIEKMKSSNYHLTLPLLGVATFFMPCGFTRSMQLYTLSTGSFLSGALTMFSFALGTLPVLFFLSLSSFTFAKKSWSGVFFKTVGLLVIALALLNIFSSFYIQNFTY